MQLPCGLRCKGLHHAEYDGIPEEKGKAHPDRRYLEEAEAPVCHGSALDRRGYCQRQFIAIQQQQQQHGKCQCTSRSQSHTPRECKRQRHKHGRRQRPAQAAGDAMHAIGMAQARTADLAVEQRVVNRVKNAIAQPGKYHKAGHHPVAGADRITKSGNTNQGQAGKEYGTRAKTVHHKARQRLHRTGHHKKDGHEKAKLGIADTEFRFEPGKQRCQQQLAEVADQMAGADQADHAGVRPQRHAGSRLVEGA